MGLQEQFRRYLAERGIHPTEAELAEVLTLATSMQFDDNGGLETDPIASIANKGASEASKRVREAAARIRETVKKK